MRGSLLSHELLLKAVEVEHDWEAVDCHSRDHMEGARKQSAPLGTTKVANS